MEPGDEHRDDLNRLREAALARKPQWSPVTNTGMTSVTEDGQAIASSPQWSPVTNTGMTALASSLHAWKLLAAMEPGDEHRDDHDSDKDRDRVRDAAMEPGDEHRDDEYPDAAVMPSSPPQWSPVTNTGMTGATATMIVAGQRAAMEPGDEHRDDIAAGG